MAIQFRPMFERNRHRTDPYRSFKFVVSWDNEAVAGLSKMSALKWSSETTVWRETGDPSLERRLPGPVSFEPVTLEAGLSRSRKFVDWANSVYSLKGTPSFRLDWYRKTLTVEVLNLQGVTVHAYRLKRAFVSAFQVLPDLDASANAVAIQSITLDHEGFELVDVPEVLER